MRKNVASQHISFALVVATTGAALVGASPAGYISKDGAAQGALAGSFTGLGNGQYDYAPTQAETNCNEMGIIFIAATAIPVGLTIYTTAADPSSATNLGLSNLDAAVSTRAAPGDAMTLTAGAVDTILDDASEGAYTIREILRLAVAALAGKISGGGTATITIRDINDTKNRIVATVDVNGNRTNVTLDAT